MGRGGLPLLFPLVLLLVAGCAGKPWTTPVTDLEDQHIRRIFEEMQRRDSSCFASMDARVRVFWDGPGEARSISGFLQLMLPSSVRFVVTNPLEQPLYALVSNGHDFQSINTVSRQHTSGKISALIRQYGIPVPLVSDQWGYWLTGRLHEQGASIEAIRQDEAGRGVWLTMRYPGEEAPAHSHLLLQPETRRLLSRILVDGQGETIATLSYDHGTAQGDCPPVGRLTMSGLPYGSRLIVEFTEVLSDQLFSASTFRLKVPPGYEEKVPAGDRDGEKGGED
jgi:outer membrane lipoprotein-sorting protein